ncbi:hypothetical protein KAFR_0I00780 [Kazachstania africana CBS 2517]|uniref:Uncharacterized protein n=1 Tax=Kazachstania africana (strain ATCC 22294 / BCRC 22015 / CBS 2517 / CECT 1963 / NBRC 1671 / NRRL Y-8276) TaxID=1071382 RepID=H2AZQ9_KAZAF|nr:hypothetical protein KAFR_0I00780 [Kazachstania africana CBS 2517]CCF59859.1 hypothetical protein KAFR_0I00780 [Kazachstania africana CBS 2517]
MSLFIKLLNERDDRLGKLRSEAHLKGGDIIVQKPPSGHARAVIEEPASVMTASPTGEFSDQEIGHVRDAPMKTTVKNESNDVDDFKLSLKPQLEELDARTDTKIKFLVRQRIVNQALNSENSE